MQQYLEQQQLLLLAKGPELLATPACSCGNLATHSKNISMNIVVLVEFGLTWFT